MYVKSGLKTCVRRDLNVLEKVDLKSCVRRDLNVLENSGFQIMCPERPECLDT